MPSRTELAYSPVNCTVVFLLPRCLEKVPFKKGAMIKILRTHFGYKLRGGGFMDTLFEESSCLTLTEINVQSGTRRGQIGRCKWAALWAMRCVIRISDSAEADVLCIMGESLRLATMDTCVRNSVTRARALQLIADSPTMEWACPTLLDTCVES